MSRIFSPWTSDEEARLLASSSSGLPLHTIAVEHSRTPRAIKLRLDRLFIAHILGGTPVAEAVRLTGLSMKAVQTLGKTDSGRLIPTVAHPMFTRKSLQGARAARIQADTRRVVDRLISDHILPTAVTGETRTVITPATITHILSYHLPTPMVRPTIVEIQEVMAKVLPDVDVYVVTQINHPDAYTSTRLDTLTVDWS